MEKIPSTIESPSDKIRRLVMDVIGRVNIVEFQNKMVAFAKQIRKNQIRHAFRKIPPPQGAPAERS